MSLHSINYVDVSKIPKTDIFLVDTNALIWTFYSKASEPALQAKQYQLGDYSSFIESLIQNGNKVITTSLNLSEACIVIERNEHKLYNLFNSTQIARKAYRKIANERTKYFNEINLFFSQIENNLSEIINICVDQKNITELFITKSPNCDVFDFLITEDGKTRGVMNIISDDKDYANIDGIELFTSSSTGSLSI